MSGLLPPEAAAPAPGAPGTPQPRLGEDEQDEAAYAAARGGPAPLVGLALEGPRDLQPSQEPPPQPRSSTQARIRRRCEGRGCWRGAGPGAPCARRRAC